MSHAAILSKEEFLDRVEVQEAILDHWVEAGLLVPVGRTTGKVAFFAPAQIETVRKLQTLFDLGYDEAAVMKIVRKIGLPGGAPVASKKEGRVPAKLRTIGEIAQAVGVNPRTIKHWEDKTLLAPDARSEGGFRLYGPATVRRCRRIQDLQHLGYSLESIRGVHLLLEELDALPAALGENVDEAGLDALAADNKALGERLETVRASAKRQEDQMRRRAKLLHSLRAALTRRRKEEKRREESVVRPTS